MFSGRYTSELFCSASDAAEGSVHHLRHLRYLVVDGPVRPSASTLGTPLRRLGYSILTFDSMDDMSHSSTFCLMTM